MVHRVVLCLLYVNCFVLIDPATDNIYPLSLHDALPISRADPRAVGHQSQLDCRFYGGGGCGLQRVRDRLSGGGEDRKSTRLNSSHVKISYAVFCWKKKTNPKTIEAFTITRNCFRVWW